nr:EAL domain-containing protein [Pseudomonas sp. dw_358]
MLWVICVATLGCLWGLYAQQKATAFHEAMNAKAAEHLNLATIAAENLQQLVDRAQITGTVAREGLEGTDPHHWSLVRMLAGDPVLKRMALFSRDGISLDATRQDDPPPLSDTWLAQLHAHIAHYGFTPLMPAPPASTAPGAAPSWRLPFLLPLVDPATGQLERILLMQFDIGYMAALFEHIDLGPSGMLRLLDDNGEERLRISNNGVVIAGHVLSPALPDGVETSGEFVQQLGDVDYQSLYRRVPQRGFSVIVSQPREEILAAAQITFRRQLALNLGMTLFILAGLSWTLRALGRRQEAFMALEDAQRVNQELISRLEEQHRLSSKAAATDHLSGLHNRRRFLECATPLLARQRSKRLLTAILFIDMDRFKSINDSLGHKVGDLLLQAIAGRISRLLTPTDEAARFGGDEFIVLLGGERTEEQIESWVRHLVERLSAVYSLDGQELITSPSVGVSICPRDGQDLEDLIRGADAAMYSAKSVGRGQYRFFDPSLNVTDVNEFILEQAFVGALSDHQFVLHFQPQVRLDTLLVEGYEALVRWQHPEFGLLYPDRFIGLAERSGFIVALGWEVLRLACIELSDWKAQKRPMRMAINVSTLQLRQVDFSQRVLAQLTRYGLDPGRLELEITETIMLDDEAQAIEHLQTLRDAGLNISLDDFGKGYAGFAHLQNLPLTKLKIDRSVIAPLSNSPDDSPIVTSTIILAKRLGLEVVAEGVETRENVICLKLAGCDVAQGYHFSRPLSASQLRDYPPFMNILEKACTP